MGECNLTPMRVVREARLELLLAKGERCLRLSAHHVKQCPRGSPVTGQQWVSIAPTVQFIDVEEQLEQPEKKAWRLCMTVLMKALRCDFQTMHVRRCVPGTSKLQANSHNCITIGCVWRRYYF
jgi:hypothetical protein